MISACLSCLNIEKRRDPGCLLESLLWFLVTPCGYCHLNLMTLGFQPPPFCSGLLLLLDGNHLRLCRFRFFLLREAQLQNAVLKLGRNIFLMEIFANIKASLAGTAEPFSAKILTGFCFVFFFQVAGTCRKRQCTTHYI